jgi:hypothetical protein
MTKWEYKILVYPEWSKAENKFIFKTQASVEAMLNEIGAKGWELVSAGGGINLSLPQFSNEGVNTGGYTFKRRVE